MNAGSGLVVVLADDGRAPGENAADLLGVTGDLRAPFGALVECEGRARRTAIFAGADRHFPVRHFSTRIGEGGFLWVGNCLEDLRP